MKDKIDKKADMTGKEVPINEPAPAEGDIQEIIAKYDTESRFRRVEGWQKVLVSGWLIAMAAFHIWAAYFGVLPIAIIRAIHLTFAIVAVFLLFPGTEKGNKRQIPWYDWLLALLGGGSIGYIVFMFNDLSRRGAEAYPYEIWLGLLAIVMVIEAGRRVVGKVLPVLAFLFLLYCYFGSYVPGMFQIRGYSINRIVQHMYLTPEGIFGVALGVSATFVIMFIIFGCFLARSGGGRLFNDLALALAGGTPGGPAKVCVIASGLMGTINGSSVANCATTGTFTIPLMKRVGYTPEYAAAIEACASTGGQLMPPIMGAGAFIMSEFLGIPYLRIAVAATLPAILYYFCLLASVHIKARREQMKSLSKEELPELKQVLKKDGHLLIPLIVVIVTLLMRMTPTASAFWGIVSVVIVSWFKPHTRMGLKEILGAMEDGARGCLGVALACALVGFIVGTSSLTSLGLTISNNIIELSGGKVLPMLIMAMIASLVLGMGLPTTANYIVCSTIIAPALIGLGTIPLSAHMFVFYFGIMADLTPPVCLAAFTAAGIARADPTMSGIKATMIATIAFFLPYSFVYTPEILLIHPHLLTLSIDVIGFAIGIIAIAGGAQGWMYRDLKIVERLPFAFLGIAAFLPHYGITVAASAAILVALVYFKWSAKRVTLNITI